MNKEYAQKACEDVSSLFEGKITRADFVQAYKSGASESRDYAAVVEDILLPDMAGRIDMRQTAERWGVEPRDVLKLSLSSAHPDSKDALVDALYEVGYTRIPNNDKGGDGKPAAYDRKRNSGLAAERALFSLSRIPEYSDAMTALQNAYFYPRTGSGKVKDAVVLDLVKQDAQACAKENTQAAGRVAASKVAAR